MMDMPVYNLSVWMGEIFLVVLLICAVSFCYRPYNPTYMRSFPLYCGVNLLSEILAWRFPAQKQVLYNLFGSFELVYFAYFLTSIIGSPWVKQLVWTLVWVTIGSLWIYLVETDINQFNLMAVLVEAIILSMTCLVYFREIFLTKRILNLLQEPSFWMVTGILFYMLLSIPVFLFTNYLLYREPPRVVSAVYSVHNFALIVTYTLFIKAMTCRRQVL